VKNICKKTIAEGRKKINALLHNEAQKKKIGIKGDKKNF